MRFRTSYALGWLLLAVLLGMPAQAQPTSHPIGLQGLLLNADGEPLSGTYDLTFRLFSAANGGSTLWTEMHSGVPVSEGLYEVALGMSQDLPSDLFTTAPRYLEVSVGGEVLAPRIPLRAVPLANTARTLADGALQAGSNVSITRQAGGILRIDANGGGGSGGLSSVATDATIDGDGTSGDPLGLSDGAVTESKIAGGAVTGAKIADGALQAGSNVTITRQDNGTLEIEATGGGGGGGGLTSVTSDATLTGNGTSGSPLGLANGAVTSAKLATNAVTTQNVSDGAVTGSKIANGTVTGAKIADGALVAGSNVTITRQGSGALEIAAASGGGLSLPFAGSTSSNGAAFSVANTGNGDGINVTSGNFGIRVTQAGSHGLLIDQANDGVNVQSASGAGVAVGVAGGEGLRVTSAGNDGVSVQSAGRYGLNVVNAVRGVDINTTSSDGMVVRNAGGHGLLVNDTASNGVQVNQAGTNGVEVIQTVADGVQVQSAGRDGVRVSGANQHGVAIVTTGLDGFFVSAPGRHGLKIGTASSGHGVQIDQAGFNGLQIDQAGTNGIQVGQTTVDGIQIQNAGRDGIRVSSASGVAGQFQGDVNVSGTLVKGGGSFRIDHPLDPANTYLAHSFVESPDMMNVYNGNAVLDASGEATVTLPDYFEALNRDFRYQLTPIGAPGPNLYIAETIRGNRFRIAGGTPGLEVSWQVTGIRQDAWANEHRIVVEEAKPADERGYYLHPRLYGQPEARNVIHHDARDDF